MVNRDTKVFYKKFAKGQIVNVVGLDIPFTKPDKADLIIENTKTKEYLLKYADIIIEKVFAKQ